MNRKNKKGISPVVATVIIVAIAIALAIAVALWASGLVGIFTRFEEVKVVSAYAIAGTTAGDFDVYLDLKNTGSADATIDNVIINGKPFSTGYPAGSITVQIKVGTGTPQTLDPSGASGVTGVSLKSGETGVMTISIDAAVGFMSGQTLDIKIHTAAGHDYAKAVVLP